MSVTIEGLNELSTMLTEIAPRAARRYMRKALGAGWTAAVSDTVPTTTVTRSGIIYEVVASTGNYTPTWAGSHTSGNSTLSFYYGSIFVPMCGAFGVGI